MKLSQNLSNDANLSAALIRLISKFGKKVHLKSFEKKSD
jgi:hypothetical protein